MFVVEKLVMTPDEICGFVIGDICGIPYNPYHEWRVAFPPIPKPPVSRPEPPPVSIVFLLYYTSLLLFILY